MQRRLINWMGLAGIASLLSYTAAVVLSPQAYPGYDWMSQAVSDLSAATAPSRALWDQLASPYEVCSVVSATCAAIFVTECEVSTKTFRRGVYLFALMRWVSDVGYGLFPLSEAGTGIAAFQDVMHVYVVTAVVVLLSLVSLSLLVVAGRRDQCVRMLGRFAALALAMMLVGAVGKGLVPLAYFGVVERFSVFAAVGYDAVLGTFLFRGFA